MYSNEMQYDYLQDVERNDLYRSSEHAGRQRVESDLTEEHVVDEPLSTAYPELDKVGALADEFDKQSSYSEDEGIEDYKKGGYHPVFIGEILNGRYVVLQKLGWGHFSTVWLSRDIKYNTFVAIKVQKSASHYLEAAFDEVEILQKAATHASQKEFIEDLKAIYQGEKTEFGVDDCHVVQLLNAFIYQGPYGKHFCMVFEILGVNLLEIIKRYDYKGIPLPICREMSKQVLIGLHYLHKYCGIIHTDLKPENVMVCLDHKELKEIYESGQLNTKQEIQKRLNAIRRKIAQLSSADADNADVVSENAESPYSERIAKDSDPAPQHKEGNVDFSFAASENRNEEDALAPILTEEDLQKEYERLIAEKGITNKNEKKNLKKKLKKRLKRAKQRAEHQSAAKPEPMNSLRANLLRTQAKPPGKKPIASHPMFFKSGLSENFKIKIADLGNGCWTHHHFQPEIQTRQYRSPEVILGINYNHTADIWSFACMLFEMITGEFLFDPRKNPDYSKSQDHLALMMEVLNKFPRNFSTIGTHSKKYLDVYGSLRKVQVLNFVSLKQLLVNKYGALAKQAEQLADFILPMLKIYPQDRISALGALRHPWLESEAGQMFEYPERQILPEFPNHTPVEVIDPCFEVAVDEEDYFADKSNASIEAFEDDTIDEPTAVPDFYDKECKYFDRSFKNVYVGYADGIDLNALDNTANWQFDHARH